MSYILMGILFEVHNKLGTKYQEKHYQRAIEIKLKELKIPYQKELGIDINFGKEKIGKLFIDFVIANKIILEVKKTPAITKDHIKQVLRYLNALNLKLGIITNFQHKKLEYKRVINSRAFAP
ncbi:GxxExxY protein [Candidatus Parcubacteria bacterium]|nr:GxxExxY protein [Candidatus Parcubacteria bacterium]